MHKLVDVANEIFNSIKNNSPLLSHTNMVIVGENDTGKTTLLKELLERFKTENCDEYYYIDALNRLISCDNANNLTNKRFADYTPGSILKTRINTNFFSQLDIFCDGDPGALVAYSELCHDLTHYEKVFSYFFNCKLKLPTSHSLVSGFDKVLVNGKPIDGLSSSMRAKMRLIMEIDYAKRCNCKVVIIDEFDCHIDPNSLPVFIEQLISVYSELRFLLVIHDFSAIVKLSGMDAVIYNNPRTALEEVLCLDCDNITEIGQVSKIRSNYISQKDKKELFLSECVSTYVNKGVITPEQESEIKKIDRKTLNTKNKVLYDFVMGSSGKRA